MRLVEKKAADQQHSTPRTVTGGSSRQLARAQRHLSVVCRPAEVAESERDVAATQSVAMPH